MARRRLKRSNDHNEPSIRFREEDLVQLREICDTIYGIYDLIRDREDSVPMDACCDRRFERLAGLSKRWRIDWTGRSQLSVVV